MPSNAAIWTRPARGTYGDLLLQVVLPRAAWPRRLVQVFSFGDVVQAITAKDDPPPSARVRRREGARSAGMAKGMWEKIKAEKKAQTRRHAPRHAASTLRTHGKGFLDGVPSRFRPSPER